MLLRMRTTAACGLIGLCISTFSPAASAQTARAGASVNAALLASDVGAGLGFDARWHLPGGQQLGLGASAAWLGTAYVGGRKVHAAFSGQAQLSALFPLLERRPLSLDLRISSGLRVLRDTAEREASDRTALRSVSELGLLAHVRLDERHLLRAGPLLTLEFELKPTFAVADQAQLLTLGVGRALTRDLLLYATVDAGGSYGFDGDNGKAMVRGALGLRFGGDALRAF